MPVAVSPRPSSEASSDDHLLTLSTAGSAVALGQLYDRYGARALRLASAICLEPTDAELAVELAFTALRDGPADTSAHQRPSSWLLTLVTRSAISRARDSRSRSPLAGLPDDRAEAIALAHYGRLTSLEIADQLNITSAEVKQLIRGGLHELRADTDPRPLLGSFARADRTPAAASPPGHGIKVSRPGIALLLAAATVVAAVTHGNRHRRARRKS